MPYSSASEVPSNVPADKKKQWMEVWNSAHARALKDGKSPKDAEASAFAQANSVAGPNSKVAKSGTKLVHYEAEANSTDQCQFCVFYEAGTCSNAKVAQDPEVPCSADGKKLVNFSGWCEEFQHKVAQETATHDDAGESVKSMTTNGLIKRVFVPFAKVDASKREVWGIVTAEVPDKEDEVCDYAGSKPHYQSVIDEMSKATDGGNFMPLRQMHSTAQPVAGKSIGYEFRDLDKEIFMGFKVVDDGAWRKVEEKVYTGFSHGGVKVGEDVPDPVFKGCMRYVAKPSEISLVDNPCLGVAHFQYVSKDGAVEMRKNRSVEPKADHGLRKEFDELKARFEALSKNSSVTVTLPTMTVNSVTTLKSEEKTKRVAGEELKSGAFLIVGNAQDTKTWHLPVKFSTEKKTKNHIQDALSRINQVKGITEDVRAAAQKRLNALAAQHGIDVNKEKQKFAAVLASLRKSLRVKVSRYARDHGDPGHALSFVDSELGKLAKGMCEVSNLSWLVQDLACLVCNVCAEQEWEEDATSPLPGMLETAMDHMLDVLVAMVAEESQEMRDAIANRVS